MSIARVSAGRGVTWIKAAIELITDRPVVWIGGTAAVIGLSLVLSLIPVLGQLLTQILNFAMGLFFLTYAQAQKKGVDYDIDHAWAQAKGRVPRLIVIMLVSSVLFLLCSLPFAGTLLVVGGLEFLSQPSGRPDFSTVSIMALAISGLVSLVAAFYVMAAMSFTTPLILLRNLPVSTSMGLSLRAVTQNVLPLFLYGLMIGLLMFISIIPFGLGLLLWFPTMTASFYVAYEELMIE
jgi:uncharacterized membrane protein